MLSSFDLCQRQVGFIRVWRRILLVLVLLGMGVFLLRPGFESAAWAQAGEVGLGGAGAAVGTQGAPQAPAFGELISRMTPMFLILFFIIYFMVLRPQNDKLKQHAALMTALKKGDQVVTSSGLIARVAGIEKEYILLEISNGVRAKFEPSHVVKIFEDPKVEVAKAG